MVQDKAYILDSPPVGHNEFAYVNIVGGGGQPDICECCGAVTSFKNIRPLEVAMYGRSFGDFVWSDSTEFLIGKHLLNTLQKHSLTGFEVYDVDISEFYEDGDEVPLSMYEPGSLYYLYVTGKGGRLRTATKGIITEKYCEICGRGRYKSNFSSFVISKPEWDGSDIFCCEEFGYIFITEAFLKILRDYHINNYEIGTVKMV